MSAAVKVIHGQTSMTCTIKDNDEFEWTLEQALATFTDGQDIHGGIKWNEDGRTVGEVVRRVDGELIRFPKDWSKR